MTEAILGVVFFSAIVLLLTLFVLGARRLLVPHGVCEVEINARKKVTAEIGQRLLDVCQGAGILLPSACGGAGTCGLCKARVLRGGGEAGPQELALLNRREAKLGVRLACQLSVVGPMSVEVEDSFFAAKTWHCTVEKSHNVSTLIREILLRLPEGEQLDYRAGGFVQLTSPPFQLDFSTIEIDSEFAELWDSFGIRKLKAGSDQPVTRAYSMASYPAEQGIIMLNIRIALPPPGQQVPPGVVSSWLFSLKPGDSVDVVGPFGDFYVDPGDGEAVFIGGGAGMAPLRAQILDLLETQQSKRKISFWYGARSRRELFYDDVFERLQREHANFSWHPVLSQALPADAWEGYIGYVHQVSLDNYLMRHNSPESCDYYLCGPPLMVQSTLEMLDELGASSEKIHYDDFSS